jgi:dolichol-phosphate mannosyltransferase
MQELKSSASPASRPLLLAVVIPTFNERDNVEPMLALLEKALAGIPYEVLFVDDDSPDGTAEVVRSISQRDVRVRILQRVNRRGLASACLEGMMATAASYIAVIDADLQHDERILPKMLEKCRQEQLDLVIGTRNVEGGGMGDFSASRIRLSQLGRKLSQWIAKTELSDPMSGFFLVNRHWLDEVIHLASGIGFKILLDLVASSPRRVRVGEVPYVFRTRQFGESKLDILVGLEYLELLLDKSIGHLIPPRFAIFCLVGTFGLLLAVLLFYLLNQIGGYSFEQSQIIVTVIVMIVNFFVNNSVTYRSQRLKGSAMWFGLGTFIIACSAGAVINLRIAEYVRSTEFPWYVAVAAGLMAGSAWNYGVTSVFTWRNHLRSRSARTIRSNAESAS